MHCQPVPERGIYGSPLIAYVRNDTNEIQSHLIKQLDSHFSNYDAVVDMVANFQPL